MTSTLSFRQKAPLDVPGHPLVPVAAVLLALAVAAPTPTPLVAQDSDSDSTAVLTGKVVSAMTGGPLESAQVVLKQADRGTLTDSAGRFNFPRVPAGMDTVRVSLIGFADNEVPLRLKPGHTTTVTLLLSETVLKVEDITVEVERRRTGKLAGFEKRRQRGHGHFITPEEIEEKQARHPSDLLRGVPGVSVGSYNLGKAPVRVTRQPVGNCDVTYWVDGVVRQDFHIDDLNRDDIMAMEIYRGSSETPPQFLFNNRGCGTIVIWTQEGGR